VPSLGFNLGRYSEIGVWRDPCPLEIFDAPLNTHPSGAPIPGPPKVPPSTCFTMAIWPSFAHSYGTFQPKRVKYIVYVGKLPVAILALVMDGRLWVARPRLFSLRANGVLASIDCCSITHGLTRYQAYPRMDTASREPLGEKSRKRQDTQLYIVKTVDFATRIA